jgi:hypothetical protein
MSKKDLARTAIEGGRANWNKQERRRSTRAERRILAQEVREISRTPYDDIPLRHSRKPLRKEFADKLKGPYRMIESLAGKSEQEILRIIRARFDAKTLAGRHILFDHLLNASGWSHDKPRVNLHYNSAFRFNERGGILVRKPTKVGKKGGRRLAKKESWKKRIQRENEARLKADKKRLEKEERITFALKNSISTTQRGRDRARAQYWHRLRREAA